MYLAHLLDVRPCYLCLCSLIIMVFYLVLGFQAAVTDTRDSHGTCLCEECAWQQEVQAAADNSLRTVHVSFNVYCTVWK